MKKQDFELYFVVDADGCSESAPERDTAMERYAELGGVTDFTPIRVIKITLAVDLPEDVELRGVAPAVGTAELTRVEDSTP